MLCLRVIQGRVGKVLRMPRSAQNIYKHTVRVCYPYPYESTVRNFYSWGISLSLQPVHGLLWVKRYTEVYLSWKDQVKTS